MDRLLGKITGTAVNGTGNAAQTATAGLLCKEDCADGEVSQIRAALEEERNARQALEELLRSCLDRVAALESSSRTDGYNVAESSLRNGDSLQLQERVEVLEAELATLRRDVEYAGSDAITVKAVEAASEGLMTVQALAAQQQRQIEELTRNVSTVRDAVGANLEQRRSSSVETSELVERGQGDLARRCARNEAAVGSLQKQVAELQSLVQRVQQPLRQQQQRTQSQQRGAQQGTPSQPRRSLSPQQLLQVQQLATAASLSSSSLKRPPSASGDDSRGPSPTRGQSPTPMQVTPMAQSPSATLRVTSGHRQPTGGSMVAASPTGGPANSGSATAAPPTSHAAQQQSPNIGASDGRRVMSPSAEIFAGRAVRPMPDAPPVVLQSSKVGLNPWQGGRHSMPSRVTLGHMMRTGSPQNATGGAPLQSPTQGYSQSQGQQGGGASGSQPAGPPVPPRVLIGSPTSTTTMRNSHGSPLMSPRGRAIEAAHPRGSRGAPGATGTSPPPTAVASADPGGPRSLTPGPGTLATVGTVGPVNAGTSLGTTSSAVAPAASAIPTSSAPERRAAATSTVPARSATRLTQVAQRRL
eukprot:TRINITY_DN25282_c0_g1_i1.p1 TRINITY_DN25282_c0_g1~~TRINITY_DN25282_c0_g1_i1.p1  ORF type:complete len:584 (+),score=122.28 TRINITY_DN25282_c0_g1_i1:75-1826(+)